VQVSSKCISISAEHLALWLDFFSQQPGFIHFSCPGGEFLSAWPTQQWTIPVEQADYEVTLDAIRNAHCQATQQAKLTRSNKDGALEAFEGGIAGYLSYELGAHTVPGFLPGWTEQSPTSLGWVGLFLWSLVIPDDRQSARLHVQPGCSSFISDHLRELEKGEPPPVAPRPEFRLIQAFQPDATAGEYRQKVKKILDLIMAGDCYQVNLSQRYQGRFDGAPFFAYQALREAIPVPHAGYMNAGDEQILSISPERLLRIRDGEVESKPIKGTRPRGKTAADDARLARDLRSSLKDRAENLMIVDLIRNDLSRFCKPHSVRVPSLFSIESYENVHQLVSTVTGTLRSNVTAFDALLSAFPGGSITGAPKRRAMEVIDDLEAHRRGPYCGSLFYWGLDGSLESNIAIRTLATDNNGNISCWGGCGIVADSDPEDEYQESVTKIRRLMETLESL
jgi:para-aminobenzoate synthetase component 1